VRLSVGIEDVRDIIADLENALQVATGKKVAAQVAGAGVPNALQAAREGNLTLLDGAPFRLDSGLTLQPVSIRYAVYGELNEQRDNAVLVCHALPGSARVSDWWPEMFCNTGLDTEGTISGIFDLSRDCVICTNILGSCYGSTGPASVDAATGKPFGPDFPLVTIRDTVRAQVHVLDALGIERLRTVIGASIGGMQALQWAVDYPGAWSMASLLAVRRCPQWVLL
jgi:homoserine O-acetyltransferase/O-succinyltransferase